jgi:hypothetical protein
MRKLGSKKRFAVIAATTAAVLVGGGVAVAYWTTTGTGTGSAATGDSSTVTVTQTNTVTGLYPGGPAADVDLHISNGNASAQHIATVTLTNVTTDQPGCTAADFAVTDATINADVPSGGDDYAGATTGASVQMIDTGSNQDACKNANVSFDLTAS